MVFINFRNDRARQLTIALTQVDMPEYGMKTIPLHYYTMTPYDAEFNGLKQKNMPMLHFSSREEGRKNSEMKAGYSYLHRRLLLMI